MAELQAETAGEVPPAPGHVRSTVVDRKLVFTKNWTAVGNHSIRIVVAGTSGHPKIVVDQIFVLQ